jgi:dinuclear metal center YbgI/SA1388 family protein
MKQKRMKVMDVAAAVDGIVPLKLAQDWDNVGLLVGDPQQNVGNILLTIDVTGDVVSEAKKLKTDLILSYHPLIWDGLKSITTDGDGKIVHELVRSGISVFSVHTALDTVAGGVNDALAEIMALQDVEPLGDYVANPAGDNLKLTVFVPVDSLDKVANAVFAAGAGHIGNYSHCGFGTDGTGTFLPLDGARPAIGKKGKFEKVHETRFESIVPGAKVAGVVAAMKKAHPYEMPAFDCYRLHDTESKYGLGRIGKLEKPLRVDEIIQRVKKATGARAVGIVGRDKRTVRKAAVCAGSCGKIINTVIASGADLYLTGELKHHLALAAQEAGLTCLCLSHTVSERFMLKKFAKQLGRQIGPVTIKISKKDADPFKWKEI